VQLSTPLAALVALLGYATASVLISPTRHARMPVLCPLRRLTGLPCPSCGMTRSASLLVRGRPRAALRENALSPVALAVLGWLALQPRDQAGSRDPSVAIGALLLFTGYGLIRALTAAVSGRRGTS
jgi:hypothetical protein